VYQDRRIAKFRQISTQIKIKLQKKTYGSNVAMFRDEGGDSVERNIILYGLI
jgi:hypothetical protein